MKMKLLAGAGALALLGAFAAHAAGFFTPGLPLATSNPATGFVQTLPLTGSEQIPADTLLSGGANPQSEAITTGMLANYVSGGPSKGNAIIAGDGTQNLWQRGTAGTSTTSATVAWKSADRWGQWALSSAGVKIVRDSTAADLPAGYQYAIALTHTNSTAGQICMGQWILGANAYQFQGQTAELDFHAATGAGYTGTTTLTAYITYGTGSNEGLNKMAFTVNAGGATGWTGGANATAAVVPLSAVSTNGRFAAIANIPATATEVGVAFCYTAGTTSTNDYVAFDGIQLVRNPTLSGSVSTTAAVSSATVPLTALQRRDDTLENVLQYTYYYQLNDPAATATVGTCQVITANTTAVCLVPLPIPMWTAPTITAPGSNTAFAITAANGAANVCTALAVTASSTVPQPGGMISVTCTPTSNIAITVPSQLIGDAQAFSISANTEL